MTARPLTELNEQHAMELAAISTVCLQNTLTTIKDRIDNSHPYWTVAYGDVVQVVNCEILWRETLRHVAPNLYQKIINELMDGKPPLSLLP